MAEMSPLRRRMVEDMTVRNLSPATQRSYVSAVAKFSRHFGRSPDRLGLEEVRAFQVHLVADGISWAYLGRYTHRVAIANSRLVSCDQDHVAFTWKDYRQNGATKLMRLTPHEFIRRFLLHTLPDGFHRIRHVGFLANGHRATKLALCRALLSAAKPSAAACTEGEKSLPDRNDAPACPLCGGIMRITSLLPPNSAKFADRAATFRCDTS